MELQIDLDDAILKGSEENINKVDQILSTYQLRINDTSRYGDAYLTCANNTYLSNCSSYLEP
jgi:hypothetical protein